MTAMSGGTETHRHFLYDDCHAKREHNEGNEESASKPCARRGLGKHAGAVVLSQHNENSRSEEQPQQMEPGKDTPLGAGGGHTHPVMRTINVLMSDNDVFLGDGWRRHPGQRSHAHKRFFRSALRTPALSCEKNF